MAQTASGSPFLGGSYFRKKAFCVFGGTTHSLNVPFWGFLISGKKLLPISGVQRIRLMSLLGGSYFRKKAFAFSGGIISAGCVATLHHRHHLNQN
jgi:hypothetical protein